MTNLLELAFQNNVKVIDNGNGHIQLIGKLTVNYYPNSEKQTAYINGCTKGIYGVTPKQAVKMANTIPNLPKNLKVKRKNNYKGSKNILLKKHPFCKWCDTPLTKETATIEHIIPLSVGGANNRNNYAIACNDCNQKRGSDMPELNEEK